MEKLIYIHTFGCQMNVHDSEKMLGILEESGYSRTEDPLRADLVIFNTCSIRQKAEQKFYSELGRLRSHKKRNNGLKIAVAGCIAKHEGRNIFKRAPHVDFIFGPQNIHVLRDFSSGRIIPVSIKDDPEIAKRKLPAKREEGIKAWVTIMYGCNNFCSYCVVPFTRGRERSRGSEDIYSEVSELADKGYKEITLLGQNVNSYKSDIDFPGLLRKLDKIDGIKRIRFVTSHPKDLSNNLVDAMAELPKVCEHIHLPLQSGSTKILKKMNRGYSFEDYMKKVSVIRNKIPNISITSDIIAGFPGETENDHLQTLNALKEIEFDGIFAFKFSSRHGTKAYEMREHLAEEKKSERLNEILIIQDEITKRKNKSLEGTMQEILVGGISETDKEKMTGRTRANKIVNISAKNLEIGKLINVEITKGRRHSLEGKYL